MKSQSSIAPTRNLTVAACLALPLVALLAGCDSGPSPTAGPVQVAPSAKVAPGQKVALSIDVQGMKSSGTITWSATRGAFPENPAGAGTTYQAPSEPGPVVIACTVTSGRHKLTKTLTLEVTAGENAPGRLDAVVEGGQAALPTVSVVKPNPGSPPPASPVSKPFDIELSGYVAAGFMGDGEKGPQFLSVVRNCTDSPHSPPTCQKWTYKPGPEGFAAVAYQSPPNNWGGLPGKNLSGAGFTRVSWFARGTKGGEQVQFLAGGNTNPTNRYQASFTVTGDFVTLTTEWKEYSLSLAGHDLSMVVSAFGWAATSAGNPNGCVFYVDSIKYF
jgi:hypothetical protein